MMSRQGTSLLKILANNAKQAGYISSQSSKLLLQSVAKTPLLESQPSRLCSAYSGKIIKQDSSQPFSTSTAIKVAEDNNESSEVTTQIQTQLAARAQGRLFAVVHFCGKQRKVTTEDIVLADQFYEADIGDKIRLNKVLLVGGKDFTLVGTPVLKPSVVKVEAVVIEKTLSHNRVIFWYRKRQNFRVFKLHRNPFTYLRITNIEVLPDSEGMQ